MNSKPSLTKLAAKYGCSQDHIKACIAYLGLSSQEERLRFVLTPETAKAVEQLKAAMTPQELRRKMTEATLERRYGNKHYNNRSKMKATKLKNFGSAEAVRQNIQQKRLATVTARYGADPNALDWKKAKGLKTLQGHYGVTNPVKLDSWRKGFAELDHKAISVKSAHTRRQHREGSCAASPTLAVVQGFSSRQACIDYSKQVEAMDHTETFSFKCIQVK